MRPYVDTLIEEIYTKRKQGQRVYEIGKMSIYDFNKEIQ